VVAALLLRRKRVAGRKEDELGWFIPNFIVWSMSSLLATPVSSAMIASLR
jgi:hypothetical protein